MAYVNMTKDFSNIKKPIAGLGITKRQLLAFFLGALCGLPVFFLLKFVLKLDVTTSLTGLTVVALPLMLALMYKKDGMYMEKHLRFYYETHFKRNTDRPYQIENMYDVMQKEEKLQKEVERIVFKGKTKEEIAKIKAAGETTELQFDKTKIVVPLKGPISRTTKKELEKAVRKAKASGKIPMSAQESIPYKIPHEDGIFESDDGYFTQTIAFEDITYQLLDNDPKNVLFERWCTLINYFSPEIHFQFNYGNMEMDKEEYSKEFTIPAQEDDYNVVRKEYSDMLVNQFAKGTNNLKKERYLTYGIHATNYKTAKKKLTKINKQLEKCLQTKLMSKSHTLNGYERLELLFRLFHPATKEKLLWNFDMPVNTGLSSKDFIAPSSFSFKSSPELNATKYFKCGDRVGAVSYLLLFAADMEDRIVSDILSINSHVWISIHGDTMPRDKALNMAKDNVADIQSIIINQQKNANQSGYDMFLLNPELENYHEAGNTLYKNIQRKDEQVFNAVITIVQTANTRKELEDNIFELNEILSPYQCRLVRLDNRQEQGYMSSLPLGNNNVEVKRTFTTTDMAIFIPFTTKDLYAGKGQYYGMNSLSNNVIMVNRKKLVNPNGLVFGMPGFGKTFFIKREILDVFLKTKDDRLIIDPEGEYIWLVKLLHGQNIKIALNSTVHINPMEINLNARNVEEGYYDPIAEKSSFVVSMCELILGNKGNLGKSEVAVIDEACKNIYYRYAKNPVPENMPILEDLYNELREMRGEKKQIGLNLSIALSRYVTGSLSYFNNRSNIDIDARLVCFNLKEMDSSQRDLTMLIIQDLIWNRVASNREIGKYTWVDIDEFHLLLRNPLTAAYSVEIWKRFRKWGGIPTGITQNIKDLFMSPQIQNILDTTNFIAMLNQSGDDARLLAEHLEISEEEENYIKTGEPGKGLLWVEGMKVPFEDDFPENTICYKVMTTKPGEAIRKGNVKLVKNKVS